ncbi:uncharacterized protein LOC110611545 [Manihot esculenta]|uniref:Uncharacterized protein n=3 Tax=Manihot esculenta TaxID=3983 RepID=A0ACB7HY10_MANES|nr:uncharacterized protein LOC110611545 [Manihot esculenta]KAG8657724.1 hypothetical protein MANES_03G087303v8 [Manihot esculenta]KAG8657725.1 hypothetical protein MANES_03G087303v8 [Manihot esculenta]OAY54595.1 hypothetical protein MANES_03G087303v8 [Manihot esculenta]
MVFSSSIIVSVAHISADAWQQITRIQLQDRLSSHQLLDLICCFPLQQLGSFALWLWTFLCLPSPDSFYPYSYYSSSGDDDQPQFHHGPASSSSSSSLDLGYYYHDSHSD